MFSTVLIANRGEIALRIARTCREMGIRVVAVHSAADRDSVGFADETVQIGPASAEHSYLYAPAILEAARRTGAEAIHPGYGFLSEDADFAEMCEAEGLVFVGPPAGVLARLGDKSRALDALAAAGVPVLPGSRRPVGTAVEAMEIAAEIGLPVLLKAVAGGGGRGMALVRERGELARTYRRTRATARKVFGDDRVYLEKFVEPARHVEVQVLAGRGGQVLHLGARDCSVQRRRQKLVEETPVPGLPADLTARICAAATRGAREVGYVGAGTVEFLVDATGAFHCIEVNCRLQVEHPVTEMVTGVDLVREQFAIAATGRPTIREATVRGAAIECRVNAEDPARGFLPTPGLVEVYSPPGGPFTRVDGFAYPGLRVPPFYDPLLAKITVWAPDRDQAIARMERALGECRLSGPGLHTTIDFAREVLAHPLFRAAKHTTGLVDDMIAQRTADA